MFPKVSCMVPTYNRQERLKRSIHMFTQQTYPNLEMIIIDDSDTPLCNSYVLPHNVRYIHLKARRSIGYKRNMAIQLAQGDWIAFWDDDDIHLPDRLLCQIKHAQETQADVVADANHVYWNNHRYYTLRNVPEIQEHLWWKRILMPSVVFKKSLMQHAAFPHRYTSEDREFFKKVLKKNPKLKIELQENKSVNFVYVIHNMNNPWSRYMAQMISVTKPYTKHCLCVK